MAELQVFRFMEKEVRTALLNNEPYFCLKDVCEVLEIKNHKDVTSRLNPKGVDSTDLLTKGGKQQATFINESNLYKVIFQSRKEEAEVFTEFVTGTILPAVRKTGTYSAPGCEKEYQTKATSAGEVSGLIKTVNKVMEKQGSRPYKIAAQTEKTLNKFGIETISDFVEEPSKQLPEQLSFEATFTLSTSKD